MDGSRRACSHKKLGAERDMDTVIQTWLNGLNDREVR